MGDEIRPDLNTVLLRLDKVEKAYYRQKYAALCILAIAALPFLLGQASPDQRVVEAQEFLVRDQDGTVRATLGLDPRGVSGLTLYSLNGEKAVELSASSNGTSVLELYDPKGHPRVTVGLVSGLNFGLLLKDEESKSHAWLTVLP